jgi:uncharacterized MAPEG superfamily protein
MTIAYYCVIVAILLPTLTVGLAKFSSRFQPKHNHKPREFLATLSGWRQRAVWAQENTFESIPAFMAAVIIAHQIGGDQKTIDTLAVSYIVLRIVYTVLYIADKALLRTLVWTAALACIIGLFFA